MSNEFYGFERFRDLTIDETATIIKRVGGIIYGLKVINPNTAQQYLKFYDDLNPTVGTTTPVHTVAIPAATASDDGTLWIAPDSPLMFFNNAIVVAAVTGRADNSTGAPTTDLIVEAYYK